MYVYDKFLIIDLNEVAEIYLNQMAVFLFHLNNLPMTKYLLKFLSFHFELKN